ncbi:DoxX family protein [Halobaculum rubrum]|uniref:DoxX family protein n=1 Tax=Halobaculum rubrum TaxID=2872158 RepID=UPI002AA2AE88|nr:DoxX-like family protein [Halobaculum rubrum]
MSLLYVAAGVLHFLAPKPFERIVPRELPAPRALVYLSGLAEIALGVGVLVPRTRRRSAKGLVLLLLAVFPANVNMAVRDAGGNPLPERAEGLYDAALWLRLPLQGLLIAWAWWYARADPEDAE